MPISLLAGNGSKYPTALHLGARRTASTAFQTALDQNREVLLESGILPQTPTRPGKRESLGIRQVVRAIDASTQEARPLRKLAMARHCRQLYRQFTNIPGARYVLFSDENILGSAFTNGRRNIHPFADGI